MNEELAEIIKMIKEEMQRYSDDVFSSPTPYEKYVEMQGVYSGLKQALQMIHHVLEKEKRRDE